MTFRAFKSCRQFIILQFIFRFIEKQSAFLYNSYVKFMVMFHSDIYYRYLLFGGFVMACNNNTVNCTCTYISCHRRGKCCECVAYHRASGEVPGCFFSKTGEKTYDRSIENLYEDYKKNR